eukprot:NODE_1028_length_1312_cov_41.108472_g847_i0.p1 GENE.NODE_1028_length_1312_cov_41.108472_g847_i0~~NODE_1028_length_1312_cov_41.108472_g847_i0.p1  ORF type:complete len:145 (+),score=30.47 NODE_1028_length_1312_cov_41.108472_g847_i0:788-1222(+)
MKETPLTLVPWELCLTCPMPWNWFDDWVGKKLPEEQRTRIQVFVDKVLGTYQRLYRAEAKDIDECVVCDAVAMAIALYPDFVTNRFTTYATIELGGRECRGQVCVDWYGNHKNRPQNTDIVVKVDTARFLNILSTIVTNHNPTT